MIPLVNKQTQIKFNYMNKPLPQSSKKIPENINQVSLESYGGVRESQKKRYTVEAFSSLQLETKKQLNSSPKIQQYQIKSLSKIQKTGITSIPETHQSLHKGQELDPVIQSAAQKISLPILKAQNPKNDAPKFKIQEIQQIKQSQFLKDPNQGNNNSQRQDGKQGNQPYDSNPYSNLYARGQGNNNEEGHHHGKRHSKQIKTFKIDNLEEKKESDFGGCCGFGITNKVAFLTKDKDK